LRFGCVVAGDELAARPLGGVVDKDDMAERALAGHSARERLEDADESKNSDLDAGFLAHLAPRAVLDRLAIMEPAAGDRPLAEERPLAALDEENVAASENDGADADRDEFSLRARIHALLYSQTMCGRYHQTAPPERLGREYDLDIRENFPPRYNVAPGQPIAVIRRSDRGARQFALVSWGFIPGWAKPDDLKKIGGRPVVNARAETVAEKETFRAAFMRRRCLVPADGFYEWKAGRDGKQPYCIRRRDDDVFSFAGIWDVARGPDGGEIDTAAIITTEAGPDLRPLHHREPSVIQRADYQRWLETDERDAKDLTALLVAPAEGFWRYFPVSKAVNNWRNDGPQLVEPLRDLFG